MLCSSCTYVDVNECSRDAGGCDDTCVNTEGSYHCHCSAGLLLAADGHSCLGELPQTCVQTLLLVLQHALVATYVLICVVFDSVMRHV